MHESNKWVIETRNIEHADWLFKLPHLLQGQYFKKFIHSSKTTRKHDNGIGIGIHFHFSYIHRLHKTYFHPVYLQTLLSLFQKMWKYCLHASMLGKNTMRNSPHKPNRTSTINKGVSATSELFSKFNSCLFIERIISEACTTKDTNFFRHIHTIRYKRSSWFSKKEISFTKTPSYHKKTHMKVKNYIFKISIW